MKNIVFGLLLLTSTVLTTSCGLSEDEKLFQETRAINLVSDYLIKEKEENYSLYVEDYDFRSTVKDHGPGRAVAYDLDTYTVDSAKVHGDDRSRYHDMFCNTEIDQCHVMVYLTMPKSSSFSHSKQRYVENNDSVSQHFQQLQCSIMPPQPVLVRMGNTEVGFCWILPHSFPREGEFDYLIKE